MSIFVDMANIDLNRGMIFGGNETVGGSTVTIRDYFLKRNIPLARDVKVNNFSLIL